jgi:hypothetical protein
MQDAEASSEIYGEEWVELGHYKNKEGGTER